MGAVLGATSKRSGSRLGCFQRLGGFLDGLCREGFLEQIIRFLAKFQMPCRTLGSRNELSLLSTRHSLVLA